MKKAFYITTPLYYVNAKPHIGHSYTEVACDCLARYHRLKGEEVLFLTGTDEHGQKIDRAARESGLAPKEFVDGIVPHFKELWAKLSVSYDDFIRTTEPRHIKAVHHALAFLHDKGDLYKSEYKGWYCTPCETFWPVRPIEESSGHSGKPALPVCLDCNRPLDEINEDNYFFKLSKYQSWLIDHINTHPDFIKPSSRRNEILSFLGMPLEDLCITRPRSRVGWGIDVPFSKNHVVYVWFDALLNYISGIGFPDDISRLEKFWPADLHIIGKDILRPHTVYWPIMLHALGLEPPKSVFAHGWWVLAGEKMSKSRGNVVNPEEVALKYGVDAYRYFLLREVSFGADGTFSDDALVTRINADLANDFGNLVNRTFTMIEKYFAGQIPDMPRSFPQDELIVSKTKALAAVVDDNMLQANFSDALASIWEVVNIANKYIEDQKPWAVSKAKDTERLKAIMYNLAEVLRISSLFAYPFMPAAAGLVWSGLGEKYLQDKINSADITPWSGDLKGRVIKKCPPLFPRILAPEQEK